jgi:hypothetical protein
MVCLFTSYTYAFKTGCTVSLKKVQGWVKLLAYADDVNILGGSVQTVKENVEALVVARLD